MERKGISYIYKSNSLSSMELMQDIMNEIFHNFTICGNGFIEVTESDNIITIKPVQIPELQTSTSVISQIESNNIENQSELIYKNTEVISFYYPNRMVVIEMFFSSNTPDHLNYNDAYFHIGKPIIFASSEKLVATRHYQEKVA